MSSKRRLLLLALALAIFVSPRPVRGQDVSGAWTLEVPVRISNANGVETIEETSTVTLTLSQDGEAVHGTWRMGALPDGRIPPARELRGTMRDGVLTLSDTTRAEVRRNDAPPTEIRMVSTFELRLDGDRLSGTQSAVSVDGTLQSEPRPLVAARAGTR